MTESVLIRGRWVVLDAAAPPLSDAALLVRDGSIAEVGPWATLHERHRDLEVLGSDSVAVLPGLINAHHHSSGVTALQQGIDDDLLEPWILAHARMRPGDVYLETLISAARLMASGVTTVVDVKSGGGSAERFAGMVRAGLRAHDEAGLRVAYAAGCGNQSFLVHGAGADQAFLESLPEDVRRLAEQLLPAPDHVSEDEYLALMQEIHRETSDHPRIDLWFGPPGPQWVSDAFMARIAEQAEAFDTGVQTHVNESFYEKLHGHRHYGRPTMLHLRDLGVLSPRFSIAHGVWLSEAEIEALADSGAAVVHNPSSNLRLRAGIAPVMTLIETGATVALGMDGTGLADDEDMFTEIRLALRLQRDPLLGHRVPSPQEILSLATAGGAKLLRQGSRLGRLRPGYAADLVLVDLERLSWPWLAPEADPLTLILLRARAGDVTTVMVAGEVVYRDGRPTRFDLDQAAGELARELAAKSIPSDREELVRRLTPHLESYYRSWADTGGEVATGEPYIRFNARS